MTSPDCETTCAAPAEVDAVPKYTPAVDGVVGLPLVLLSDPVVPVTLPSAVLVVKDEATLPLIDPLVVDMFPFVVDMFPVEVIVPFVVDRLPSVVIVPFVVVWPFVDIPNC